MILIKNSANEILIDSKLGANSKEMGNLFKAADEILVLLKYIKNIILIYFLKSKPKESNLVKWSKANQIALAPSSPISLLFSFN